MNTPSAGTYTSMSSYAPSPTQQRLQILQSRLSQNKDRRSASPERTRSSLGMSRTIAAPENEPEINNNEDTRPDFEEIARHQERVSSNEQRIEELRQSFEKLSLAMENEEAKRRAMNSTFTKNFALKIEERFIKIETELNTHAKISTTAEEARHNLRKTLDTRTAAFTDRLAALEHRVSQAVDTVDNRWEELDDRLRAMAKDVDFARDAVTTNEGTLWTRLTKQLNAMRSEMAEDRRRQREVDDARMRTVDEGVAFIKDGRDQWLRMFDYKLLPFRQSREEAEGRMEKRADDLMSELDTLKRKVAGVTDGNDLTRLEDALANIREELEEERQERERTEGQVSKLLELLVEKDELELGELEM
ncbi:Chromosome partition protein Smc [Carpediemonas membranifera]|uniref:Chromosome partition protein Smc n=1 Tax=Carpediemonas membranifera TaxID=201153 RepID=A0A8J6B865_9EUKA|nr:Chromosome partition protein Smc [Carpediemonas membranifera]|eukprot:KAG9397623.1 Chromosome partition protein Smc [Carpediemonas membranifera]